MDCNPDLMETDDLVDFLVEAIAAYRAGKPIISDHSYDHVYLAELARRVPDHPLLHTVEPERPKFGKRITHAEPMLSTEKAYVSKDVRAYINLTMAAADDLGVPHDDIRFEVTPKLDGQAGYHNGESMVTRGDGRHGNDISHIIPWIKVYSQNQITPDSIGADALGAGEIVIDDAYFEREIRKQFDMTHPRNFVSGMTDADELKPHHIKALQDGAVYFAPFAYLNQRIMTAEELLIEFLTLPEQSKTATPFATDGVVVRVANENIRDVMGANAKAHRWMLAIKEEGEHALVPVIGVTAQVGRTGQITPVLELKPTFLSRSTISRVTAHNFNFVRDEMLNVGSVIKLVRAGEVIPYIAGVTTPSKTHATISACPCCGSAVKVDGENTYCTAGPDVCRDQAEAIVLHYFDTMQNADLFGPATITMLHDAGCKTITDIMDLDQTGAMRAGLSEKESANLIEQLERSRTEPVEDWRFLASFGIRYLGRGSARKILENFGIDDLPNMSAEMLSGIRDFGGVTAPSIVSDLAQMWPVIQKVREHGVNLVLTKRASDLEGTVGNGQKIVFTGTLSIPRKEAQKLAEQSGFVPSDTVSKGSILVTGAKVGQNKTEAAIKKGAEVITEDEFMQRISRSAQSDAKPEPEPEGRTPCSLHDTEMEDEATASPVTAMPEPARKTFKVIVPHLDQR